MMLTDALNKSTGVVEAPFIIIFIWKDVQYWSSKRLCCCFMSLVLLASSAFLHYHQVITTANAVLGGDPTLRVQRFPTVMAEDWDITGILGLLVVFALPVTVLVPGFSVWDVIPKVQISRLHIFSQDLTWPQLNAAIILLLMLFFCLHLEIRKRKLDDMVEKVLTVSQATDATMEVERDRQTNTVRLCVDLLDASAEHYENLVLLRDELRKREKLKTQHPPTIVPSTPSACQ